MRRPNPSITGPIVWASIAVVLSIALLVGWTLIIVQNLPVARNSWLLVSGIISFIIIVTVLVIFSIFLVREMLEVRRQNSFIDSVTHELKSPLASLKLCLETLARNNLSGAQQSSLHEMMLDDVDRLAVFIDDVLEASRLAHTKEGMALTDIDLRELLLRCKGLVEARHKRREMIDVQVPAGLILVTDAVALETILKNLLDNAMKYSGSDGEVVVTWKQDERGRPIILVTDNGIGIPPSDLKRIFKRFYRVDRESVRERHGTGLGLFVVNSLVRYLGGRMEAHSEGEGCGTTMQVRLPETVLSQLPSSSDVNASDESRSKQATGVA